MHSSRRRIKSYLRQPLLPYGVRMFAWVRAIRWIGWGLGEALLPVFIILFSRTFAEAGLFSSSVDIAALVSLPIIGVWADKVPAKRLVLWSLLLYPLVGISYFLAGVLGLALFIILARVVNGFTWEMENVGIETYYRRGVDSARISTSFGYLDTWAHMAWIGAAFIGMLLVTVMPIYYLLLGIAPFAIIAYFLALKAPKDRMSGVSNNDPPSLIRSYGKALGGLRAWSMDLWLLGALVLFSAMISALMYFFIPINAYLTGANLPMVVLITVFGATPALFGYHLGRIADARDRYGLIALGLIGFAVVSVGLVLLPTYWFKLVAMFLMGIILELFYVIQNSFITILGPAETYGERGSAFESIAILGDLGAPLVLGIGLDVFGFEKVAIIIGSSALLLTLCYRSLRSR